MPFFQDAKSFNIHGGKFEDMQEQHNYTDDRSFKVTGDGNHTHYAPDHSVTDNRLYDSRTMSTPAHMIPPSQNPHVYTQNPEFVPSQASTMPSTLQQLQAENQLLELQLQNMKLQQEIAANSAGLRPQHFDNQGLGNHNIPTSQPLGYPSQYQHAPPELLSSNVPQYPHMLPQTVIFPQQSTSILGSGVPSHAQQPSYFNPIIHAPPQPIPPQNLLAIPHSRPATAGPPSSIASTTSGENISPGSLAAPQSTNMAVSTSTHMNPTSYGPPSGTSQPPPTVVAALVPTLSSNPVPTSDMHVNQGMGAQGNFQPAAGKKKKRSWLSKLFQKLGLKKKS